ncbi:MAG TPA: lipid II flippase MurJ [Candidatus Saccharimonadales bacterium]|nr:lipid II flippase MurJ [Candidatus Saccharimonadales bacterium]
MSVGLASVLAKMAIAAKELFVARTFGRGDDLDAFLIAFLLPSFAMTLIMGALWSALVPVLVELQEKGGPGATERLLSGVLSLSLFFLMVIALPLGLLAPFYLPYVAHGFSVEKLRLTRELLYILLPWVVISGISMLLTFILNAVEKFALPACVAVLTPMVISGFLVFKAREWGTFSLAIGTIAGGLAELLTLLYILERHGIRLRLRWSGLDPELRSILRQFAPMLAGAFLMGSTTVVNQTMAALLPAGSVATLNYASRVTNAILAIGATALSTAALPYFSKMAAENDWQGCRHTIQRYSVLIVAATLPLTLLLMALSTPLIRILFQGGVFTASDTEVVGRVQIFYVIQIPFYIWGILLVRFLSAVRRNDLVMYASALNLMLNVVFNLVLMKKWGIAGIALSTSLVYAGSWLFVGVCTWGLLARKKSGKLAAAAQGASL